MSSQSFRLISLHQRIDRAIRTELKRLRPDGIRLLRLRLLKQSIKSRLAHVFGRELLAA